MGRNNRRGVTIMQLIGGMAMSTAVIYGALKGFTQYQRASADTADKVEAEQLMDELSRTVKALWQGRALPSTVNCHCPGGTAPDQNCPAVVGGPCGSAYLISSDVPGCSGLRVHRPQRTVEVAGPPKSVITILENRDFRTICHNSNMPGVTSGKAPAPLAACEAGKRPIIERRREVDGVAAAAVQTPAVTANDVVASSICVQEVNGDYVVEMNGLLRLSRRQLVLQRKLILTPQDKSSNVEFLTK